MFLFRIFSFFLSLLTLFLLEARQEKKEYPLLEDKIDVVIVSHPKDKKTLDLCIQGIVENGENIRRVVVVSCERLTDKAEWFNERKFPFSKEEIEMTIARGSKTQAKEFFEGKHRTPGWYYQQLLKLYAPFVIPDIASNVLVIDADTIFMNPVSFLNERLGGFFCANRQDAAKLPYFVHAKKLVPGYKRIYPEVYSVCHHMLFQKPILEDLFQTVEAYHKKPFWKAFCLCVDLSSNKGASEYEIYYNFALRHTDQVELRDLKWTNSSRLSEQELFKKRGFVFVSFHDYLRENPYEKLLKERAFH